MIQGIGGKAARVRDQKRLELKGEINGVRRTMRRKAKEMLSN